MEPPLKHILEYFGFLGSSEFERRSGFFDQSPAIRFLIGFIAFLMVFFLLHFREVRVDVLDQGTIAEKYVVAQVDFEFFDEEATILSRQEAVRDIGKIYRISEVKLQDVIEEFENYLISNKTWRNKAANSTYKEVNEVKKSLEELLILCRFSDPRTLNHLQNLSLSKPEYFVMHSQGDLEEVELPEDLWEFFSSEGNDFQEDAVSLVAQFFQNKTWELLEDHQTREFFVKYVQKQVPDQFTKVLAGRRIIDQGDKVTTRHLAMINAMKKAISDRQNLWHIKTISGSAILAFLLTFFTYIFMRGFYPALVKSNKMIFLVVSLIFLTMFFAKFTEFALLSSTSAWMDKVRYPIIVPFASILMSILISGRLALFLSFYLVTFLGFSLAFEHEGFMLINLTTSLVAIVFSRTIKRRKEILQVCMYVFACALMVLFALQLYDNMLSSFRFLTDAAITLFFVACTAVFVIGLLPILETTFGILTDSALMELMDPQIPVLKRLAIEAPGTYQHSIVVGNLSEAASVAIGANGVFCRAATLYHDIGKLVNPQYFTENQVGDVNMHQLLTPLESAKVIIDHVREGVVMAREIGLPEKIIDIIKEHHGTTLVYFFYHKAKELDETVKEDDFRYMGPKPHSKESAIIMIADTLEAAARSLDKVSKEIFEELVNRLVEDKSRDGQFDECQLTFEELNKVKDAIVKALVAAHHSRVKYPKKES